MLFKQRFFSWFDSYDIYDDAGNVLYVVQGKLAWGHRLEIYNAMGNHLGTVKERVLTFLPKFEMYMGEQYIGEIKKGFTLFKPVFTLDCNGWTVQGDFWQWNYQVADALGQPVFMASKELFRMTDTYVIDLPDPRNALMALMIVLAIDAAKDSGGNR